jgi:hypothetical protein
MKRLLLIGLTLCLFSFSSFANEDGLPDALKSFYNTFSEAKYVNWTDVDGMTRIAFMLNGCEHFAYYQGDQLVVLAKKIETETLPGVLKDQLTKYHGYTISETYELKENGDKAYYVVLDKGSKHVILKGTKKWVPFLETRA